MSFILPLLEITLQVKYNLWVQACSKEKLIVKGIQGWRDPNYQDQLHAEGISPLTGRTSLHCCMLNNVPASRAFDFGVFEQGTSSLYGKYIIDGTDPRYRRAGEIAEGLKLLWGGRFVHPRPDYDHIQLVG